MPPEADRSFHLGRLTLALLAASAVGAISVMLTARLAGASVDFVTGVLILGMYFVSILIWAVLFGLPILFVLRPMGLVNTVSIALVGAVLGAGISWMAPGESFLVHWLIAGTLAGLASRWVWRWSEQRHAAGEVSAPDEQ
jgi:hypothetical protein